MPHDNYINDINSIKYITNQSLNSLFDVSSFNSDSIRVSLQNILKIFSVNNGFELPHNLRYALINILVNNCKIPSSTVFKILRDLPIIDISESKLLSEVKDAERRKYHYSRKRFFEIAEESFQHMRVKVDKELYMDTVKRLYDFLARLAFGNSYARKKNRILNAFFEIAFENIKDEDLRKLLRYIIINSARVSFLFQEGDKAKAVIGFNGLLNYYAQLKNITLDNLETFDIEAFKAFLREAKIEVNVKNDNILVIDFDTEAQSIEEARKKNYEASKQIFEALKLSGFNVIWHSTGGKGYHVLIYLSPSKLPLPYVDTLKQLTLNTLKPIIELLRKKGYVVEVKDSVQDNTLPILRHRKTGNIKEILGYAKGDFRLLRASIVSRLKQLFGGYSTGLSVYKLDLSLLLMVLNYVYDFKEGFKQDLTYWEEGFKQILEQISHIDKDIVDTKMYISASVREQLNDLRKNAYIISQLDYTLFKQKYNVDILFAQIEALRDYYIKEGIDKELFDKDIVVFDFETENDNVFMFKPVFASFFAQKLKRFVLWFIDEQDSIEVYSSGQYEIRVIHTKEGFKFLQYAFPEFVFLAIVMSNLDKGNLPFDSISELKLVNMNFDYIESFLEDPHVIYLSGYNLAFDFTILTDLLRVKDNMILEAKVLDDTVLKRKQANNFFEKDEGAPFDEQIEIPLLDNLTFIFRRRTLRTASSIDTKFSAKLGGLFFKSIDTAILAKFWQAKSDFVSANITLKRISHEFNKFFKKLEYDSSAFKADMQGIQYNIIDVLSAYELLYSLIPIEFFKRLSEFAFKINIVKQDQIFFEDEDERRILFKQLYDTLQINDLRKKFIFALIFARFNYLLNEHIKSEALAKYVNEQIETLPLKLFNHFAVLDKFYHFTKLDKDILPETQAVIDYGFDSLNMLKQVLDNKQLSLSEARRQAFDIVFEYPEVLLKPEALNLIFDIFALESLNELSKQEFYYYKLKQEAFWFITSGASIIKRLYESFVKYFNERNYLRNTKILNIDFRQFYYGGRVYRALGRIKSDNERKIYYLDFASEYPHVMNYLRIENIFANLALYPLEEVYVKVKNTSFKLDFQRAIDQAVKDFSFKPIANLISHYPNGALYVDINNAQGFKNSVDIKFSISKRSSGIKHITIGEYNVKFVEGDFDEEVHNEILAYGKKRISLYDLIFWAFQFRFNNGKWEDFWRFVKLNEEESKVLVMKQIVDISGFNAYGVESKTLTHLLLSLREQYKKLYKEAQANNNLELADKYDKMQLAVKILANAGYGALAEKTWKFKNYAIASAITGAGRLQQRILQFLAEVEGGLMVYGDTDSAFIKIKQDRLYKLFEFFKGVDELKLEEKPIEDIMVLGAKNYAFKIEGSTEYKVKIHGKGHYNAFFKGKPIFEKEFFLNLYKCILGDKQACEYSDPEIVNMSLRTTKGGQSKIVEALITYSEDKEQNIAQKGYYIDKSRGYIITHILPKGSSTYGKFIKIYSVEGKVEGVEVKYFASPLSEDKVLEFLAKLKLNLKLRQVKDVLHKRIEVIRTNFLLSSNEINMRELKQAFIDCKIILPKVVHYKFDQKPFMKYKQFKRHSTKWVLPYSFKMPSIPRFDLYHASKALANLYNLNKYVNLPIVKNADTIEFRYKYQDDRLYLVNAEDDINVIVHFPLVFSRRLIDRTLHNIVVITVHTDKPESLAVHERLQKLAWQETLKILRAFRYRYIVKFDQGGARDRFLIVLDALLIHRTYKIILDTLLAKEDFELFEEHLAEDIPITEDQAFYLDAIMQVFVKAFYNKKVIKRVIKETGKRAFLDFLVNAKIKKAQDGIHLQGYKMRASIYNHTFSDNARKAERIKRYKTARARNNFIEHIDNNPDFNVLRVELEFKSSLKNMRNPYLEMFNLPDNPFDIFKEMYHFALILVDYAKFLEFNPRFIKEFSPKGKIFKFVMKDYYSFLSEFAYRIKRFNGLHRYTNIPIIYFSTGGRGREKLLHNLKFIDDKLKARKIDLGFVSINISKDDLFSIEKYKTMFSPPK